MKLCPECGSKLNDVIGGYLCMNCSKMFSEDEVIIPQCPRCENELGNIDDRYYCFSCNSYPNDEEVVYTKGSSDYDFEYGDSGYDSEEPDYDSMIDSGDEICLNCAYWGVSQLGASYGMECRKGEFTDGPGDSCIFFTPETHFASYGDAGQYQFDETQMSISNKLYYWKNSR